MGMVRSRSWVCLCVLLALGCAAENPDGGSGNSNGSGSGDAAGAGGNDDNGGLGSLGNADNGVGASGNGGAATGGAGGTGIDPNLCGGTSVEPKVIEIEVEVEITKAEPVAIYIMLDNSGSMVGLWPGAIQAITDFVNDPLSAGLDVAVNFFPGAMFGAACDGSVYVTPTIALGRLPAYAPTIVSGLPGFPAGFNGTNIEPALRGATQYCANFTPADPADAGEKCVVLFITDGDPSTCQLDKPTLAQIAGDANTTNGVTTYTIALAGSDVAFVDDIAMRGGGDCDPNGALYTCDLTGGASFIDALTAIRETVTTIETHTEVQKQALECEWGLPEPKAGESFDKALVNVNFVPGPGVPIVGLRAVDDASACADHGDAWYYDNRDAPTRILACPKTCDVVKAAADGRIDVVLGCPTVLVE